MTDAPLTAASQSLLDDIHTLYCVRSAVATRHSTPQVMAHQVEGLVADRLAAIESAALHESGYSVERASEVARLRKALEAIRLLATDQRECLGFEQGQRGFARDVEDISRAALGPTKEDA